MNGIVTRRNIEEGENVVVGTMNNAGTVLLTVADMSSIQAEVEVDETDIPTVTIGQPAIVTIDAVPDRMWGRSDLKQDRINAPTIDSHERSLGVFFNPIKLVQGHADDLVHIIIPVSGEAADETDFFLRGRAFGIL